MRYSELKSKLFAINPKFTIIPNGGMSWGLFLKQPRHPDANEQGLIHLMGIPSPRFWSENLPKETIRNENGNILVRGWAVVVRLLHAQGYISRRDMVTYFRHDWEYKQEVSA